MALHCAKEIFHSMKTATLLAIMLGATATAYADFSYTMAQKNQGSSAAAAGASTTRILFKGQKMMSDRGAAATIVDFDAQTVTTVNKTQRTYSVTKFSDLGQGLKQNDIETKIDVRETGQTKTIDGFNASEMVMTMEMDSPQMAQAGMKMQMEMDIWKSSDVPGAREMKAFYERNGARFPWAAMTGGSGAQGMQKAMADAQRKMAGAGGVTLLQTIRTKSAGGGAQNDKMQKARAQLENMIQQGGPGAAGAQQALARMPAAGAGGGSLFEVTMESSNFSTAGIADSVFAIPAGFQKADR